MKKLHSKLLLTVLLAAGAIEHATAQTYALSNLFTVANGSGNLANSSANRGMAYNAVSNQVYTASTAPSISVFDGTLGTYIGNFSSMSGLSGGTLTLDQIGVAADGVIYGINLSTGSGSANKIYQWSNWTATPTVAFNGNALANGTSISFTSGRIGDTMAVRGSGTGTEILAGVGSTSGKGIFVIFSTTDGLNFTPTIINVGTAVSVPGNVYGLCFYTNNTFLVKPASSASSTAYLVQYPANYAGQQVVSGTVLTSAALGTSFNNTTFLSVNAAGDSLATVTPGTSSTIGYLNVANIAGGVSTRTSTNAATGNSNGNATGGVAIGLQGTNDVIYTLVTANGLSAYQVVAIPPQKPTITTAPVGGSFYLSDTLSVAASGTIPFTYQWLASVSNSATGTFTNIPGAITNVLTIATVSTNYYEVIVGNTVGTATSAPVQVTILTAVTNSAVTGLWRVVPGQTGYSWLSANDNNERGLAYDTNSQRVVVSSTSGLYVLNATNGANIETLSLTGVSFGGLLGGCDQVAIADDGAVYAGNVVNNGGNFNLYRWSSPSNIVTATTAFSGDPGNGGAGSERWGDTIAVRGAGPNTQILLSSRASAPGGTNVALLTPNDGIGLTYSSQIISVSGVPAGFAGYGLSFGAGNTFWAKNSGGDLYEIAYDPVALTGTVVFDYHQPSQIGSSLTGLGMDPVNNIIASVQPNDLPNDLQFYQLTGTSDSPVLFDQSFFATINANGNNNARVVLKYPRAYALDVNNGIVAVTYGVPATTAPSISTQPVSVTAYTNVEAITFSVSAAGSIPLYYQWRFNSNNISGATLSTYTITNPPLSSAGYYDVVVHNISGSITSTPALLTLVIPVTSPNVKQVWSIGAGTNGAYLTTSGYETRGLAFDLTTSNLLVADHNNIHVYNGTNGQYITDLNTAGLPNGGINGWVVDQVGVADDGTLYSCNLSADGTAFSIISYGTYPYGSLNAAYGGATGGNDLNTLDPVGDRWGDTMAVRGSGTDTQILLGSYNGTNVALFTTTDGVNFTPTLIAVQGGVPLGFAGLGIAFGTNNTFYAKGGHSYNLRWVSFDPVAGTGTVRQLYTAGAQVPNDLTGLAVDVTNNILGGVCFNDSPNDVQLYLLSGNSNGPSLFSQNFLPSNNPNSQENSVVNLKGGWGAALDVNNGIIGFTYSMPAAPAVTVTSVAYAPGNTVLDWNNTFDGHGYQVQYKNNLLDATWTNLGSPITANNATASYTDTTAAGGTRFYRIVSQ